MIRNPEELIARLKANPNVLGIARFGSRASFDDTPGGDLDLFVFVSESNLDVESLHFHAGEVPVDLLIRTLADLRHEYPVTQTDLALAEAEILHDPTGQVARELQSIGERGHPHTQDLSDHMVAFQRVSQKHVLDKVRPRLTSEPLLCEVLLGVNVYWLLLNYFRVRNLPYPGERKALKWIEAHEPEISKDIRSLYDSDLKAKLEVSERLTKLVLSPIGGPWQNGELIALAREDGVADLQPKGRAIFERLVGGVADRHTEHKEQDELS